MMEIICETSSCTACGACAGVCPRNCISFRIDNKVNGHIFPVIDQEMCNNCGLCERTCPVNTPLQLSKPIRTFASYAKDESVCNSSTSGGLSYSLCREILKRGGVVYGSVIKYGDGFTILHERIDDIVDLVKTQSSKYVHSKIGRDIYQSVKKDLTEGREVLFTGTGCQIAGVRNYLKKDYSNFFAIDIICHGVPSIQLLVDYLSAKYDVSQINQLSFRSKSRCSIYGMYGMYGIFGEPICLPLQSNLYMKGFMKGLYYRPACYNCHYASSNRCGDITLGDFWGLKAEFTDRPISSRGTSVTLINTGKGVRLFESIKDSVELIERPLEEAVAGNPQLRRPSRKHFAYNFFRKCYPIFGFKISATFSLVREKIFYAYALPLLNKLRGN